MAWFVCRAYRKCSEPSCIAFWQFLGTSSCGCEVACHHQCIHISSSQPRSASSSLQCTGRAENFTEHLLRQAVHQKYLDSAASVRQWSSSPSEVETQWKGYLLTVTAVSLSACCVPTSTTTDHVHRVRVEHRWQHLSASCPTLLRGAPRYL